MDNKVKKLKKCNERNQKSKGILVTILFKVTKSVTTLLLQPHWNSFLVSQFQTELRKILVSLIEVAQKLLALNPDAVELFKKANGKNKISVTLKWIIKKPVWQEALPFFYLLLLPRTYFVCWYIIFDSFCLGSLFYSTPQNTFFYIIAF